MSQTSQPVDSGAQNPVVPAAQDPAAQPAQEQAPKTDRRSADRRSSSRGDAPGGVERRASVVDRRAGIDRRAIDIGPPTGLERRRGPGRRRTDDRRSAEEGEMTDEQFEFVLAIDTYKRLNNRPFPSWTEVLEVIKQLGYRKVAPSQLNLPNMPKVGGTIETVEE
jgi:hypothetical protein